MFQDHKLLKISKERENTLEWLMECFCKYGTLTQEQKESQMDDMREFYKDRKLPLIALN